MRQPSTDPHRTLRIISVIAATSIALSSGTNYAYSAWAPQFAARLHLNATQQNLIGNFGNLGMYAMGIPGGILIDSRGPRWGVLAGCIGLACGYFSLRGAYLAGEGQTSMAALCFFGLLTGMGSCTAFSAALKVCATNWPMHRGTATAFPLSAFGLSAFFYTILSSFAFPDDTAGYLLLLACGTTIMVFVGMFFLQIVRPGGTKYTSVPTADDEEEGRPGLARKDSNPLRRSGSRNRTVGKGLLSQETGTSEETSSLVSSSSTTGPGDILDKHADDQTQADHHSHHGAEITGFQLLRTPKFWQLFIMLSLLCGVGLMTINNIGNVALALWHHHDPSASHDFIQSCQLLHVSILSFCSFLGRLSSGIGSDFLIHRSYSRFWTLVCSAALFTLAQVVALTLENPNHLFFLSGLTGLAYGALFGVYPALVADAFGPSGMGINWGAMTMAPVVSGNVFNLAYGRVLDSHSNGADGRCEEGRGCYSDAYWITLASSLVAVGWSLWCIREGKRERQRATRNA